MAARRWHRVYARGGYTSDMIGTARTLRDAEKYL